MNVSGISSVPPVPTPTAIPRVEQTSHTEAHPQNQAETDAKAKGKQQAPKAPAIEAPPIKPLSTTEMRVMLGGLPPAAMLEAVKQPTKGHFDGYA
ncbi:MAG: hypothetical protein IPJ14_05860 [Kineosporiaceae bacterium]|nr:hypothetical protein [Kineosporiaceae bacterium]MBK7622186.1 hypothetical protein [Kineosporiaceae bacterium]